MRPYKVAKSTHCCKGPKIMSNTVFYLIFLVLLPKRASSERLYNQNVYPNVTDSVSTALYFGLMLSLSGDHQSSGALAGIQAALDEINSRDDLLPGYSLHYTLIDTKVNCTSHDFDT